ncbi:MAG: Lrp/AsnC ligand binding domain-containing protein [Candidatus Brockarchaeota archaeon]|nr:Lrp/AsnC ligand binding domain-containing protein [Candidatus Brockarchaeota archaeon]
MKACILVKTGSGKHKDVSEKIKGMKGVEMVFPTFGRTDVVVNARASDFKELASLLSRISRIRGVLATETLIALEV